MQIDKVEHTLEMKGEFVTNQFTMEINAKAFDILVNKIYTDKVAAIIRELGANAWDAHVEAKTTDKPFYIHLPNSFEPYFTIRDYGTGLSQEDIQFLYTRVFKSNKTHSNDFIGCMGLGSKTPFCYVDNFAIVSYFNGIKYCYLAHKDSQGIPCISQMAGNGTATNEHNGLEITLNVNEEDYDEFAENIVKYYRYYPTRPNIVGQEINFPIESIVYQDEKYTILSGSSKSAIVMGNVPYPVSNINGKQGIIARVPIGSVDVEASREGLENTNKNKALFVKISDEIVVIANNVQMENIQGILPEQTWRLNAAKNTYCKLNRSVFGEEQRFNLYYTSNYKTYGNKVCGYLHYSRIINPISVIGGEILFIEVDSLTENKPSPLQIRWVRDNFGYLTIIFCISKSAKTDLIKELGIEETDVFQLQDIPKAKIPRTPRTTNSAGISGWQLLRQDARYQYAWINPKIDFDVNSDILVCRNNMRIIDDKAKEHRPIDIYRLLDFIGIKNKVFSLPKRDFDKYCKKNQPQLLFDIIRNRLNETKNKLETDIFWSKQYTYNKMNVEDQECYDFLLSNHGWFTKNLVKELNVAALTFPDYAKIRELEMVQSYMQEFDISLEIPLNFEVLDSIKMYKEKYKILALVQDNEEFREDIFRLLGVK